MTRLIHLWRRRTLLGLKITVSFRQPLVFSLSSLSLLYSHVSLASKSSPLCGFWLSLSPAQRCAPSNPPQCISAPPPPPTSEGRFPVAFSLRHLQLASQPPAAGNFHSVLCQVRRFAFTKPLYAFKWLHLLINNTCCLFLVKFYLVNKYYYVSLT